MSGVQRRNLQSSLSFPLEHSIEMITQAQRWSGIHWDGAFRSQKHFSNLEVIEFVTLIRRSPPAVASVLCPLKDVAVAPR